MELNEYQKQAMQTCMDSCKNPMYMGWNLMAEVGEFAGKVAKHIRHEDLRVEDNHIYFDRKRVEVGDYHHYIDELKKEAGDILWQLSGLCTVMGWELDDVAATNLQKLADRKQRGVIDGSGDNR